MPVSHQIEIGKKVFFLLRSQWWPEHRIKKYQADRLVGIMKHAVTHIPFYKDLSISPESIRSTNDLKRFPVINKQQIQDYTKDLIWPALDYPGLYVSKTSGTTCEPTSTYFDREAWLFSKYALKIRRVMAVVNPLGKKLLVVHPMPYSETIQENEERPRGLRFLSARRDLFLFDDIETHIPVLLEYKPDILSGYPSYLVELANSLKAKGIESLIVPTIFTGSEFLTQSSRDLIESVFRGRIFDVYGSTEFKEIAWQCREGAYHVNFENVFLENTQNGFNGKDEDNRLLVTTLINRAMPLLRFDIGDLAKIEWMKCICGRSSPRLSNIRGRLADFITLPSGKKVSPYLLTTIIEKNKAIRKYQIIQNSESELIIDVIMEKDENREEEFLTTKTELERALKEGMAIRFNRVHRISRPPGGKFQILQKSS